MATSREMRRRYDFFKEHAGYVVGRRAAGALDLARAEDYASAHGWYTTWEPDADGDPSSPDVREIEVAVLHDEDGEVLAALGGIEDADHNYRRVVEAELAQEAMAQGASRRRRTAHHRTGTTRHAAATRRRAWRRAG